jgi:hypothetical protein
VFIAERLFSSFFNNQEILGEETSLSMDEFIIGFNKLFNSSLDEKIKLIFRM